MSRAEARLYEVRTPRGTVYAVHELGTNRFWTERADAVARQVARERGLTVVEEQSISLNEFLRLTGRQPMEPVPGGTGTRTEAPAAPSPVAPPPPPIPVQFEFGRLSDPTAAKPAAPPSPTLTARYFLEGTPAPAEDGIVIARAEAAPPKGVFCSDPRPGQTDAEDLPPAESEP